LAGCLSGDFVRDIRVLSKTRQTFPIRDASYRLLGVRDQRAATNAGSMNFELSGGSGEQRILDTRIAFLNDSWCVASAPPIIGFDPGEIVIGLNGLE